ncbi:hypothetical protein ACFVUN_23125 [Kitasatospora griseola]|uniref:hypothetical protein n=1 Tax=Kitasatospora griseola TaxID=2064 RepID=UPI0036DAFD8E
MEAGVVVAASAWALLWHAPLWQRLVLAVFAVAGTVDLALGLIERFGQWTCARTEQTKPARR